MAKPKQARMLSTEMIGETQLKPNDIVEAPADIIKQMAEAGMVDPSAAAVAYAASEGGQIVSLIAPEPAAPPAPPAEELAAQIAAEEERLTAATAPEEKSLIQAGLDKLRALLGK